MAKRTQDIGELARALKTPAFENKEATRERTQIDPVSPTTLVLSISEIKAYEHNPRLAENREYPRLKDSIRTRRGLTTPLTVTKRPGEERYTIGAGGNSRLKALKELAEETGDEAFARVTCRFEPWDSECQVLTNHLIENDIRGYILFGDKARAIVQWRNLYEEAHPEEAPLSQRALVDCLAQAGYRIPQSLLNRLIQAAEVLMPHLPKVFASGLGRPAVEELLRLRTVALKYWDDNAAGADPRPSRTFDDVFSKTCAKEDCHYQDWDHSLFQSAFALELAQALHLDHKIVALDVDSLYHGYAVDSSAVGAAPPTKDPLGLQSDWAFERLREVEAAKAERVRARLDSNAAVREPSPAEAFEPTESPASVPAASSGSIEKPTDPSRLRQSNFAIAHRLAEALGLEAFVKPLETGFGFFIEAPEPPSPEERGAPRADPTHGVVLGGDRSARWWFLCLAADTLAPAHLSALEGTYPASWLVELFTALPERSPETDPSAALDLLVGQPARGLVFDVLTSPEFTDDESTLFAQLMRGCRALRRAAADGRLTLWERA